MFSIGCYNNVDFMYVFLYLVVLFCYADLQSVLNQDQSGMILGHQTAFYNFLWSNILLLIAAHTLKHHIFFISCYISLSSFTYIYTNRLSL